MLAALCAPLVASGAGATNTSTTLPGPAPNQSQINSTQTQVAQIEGTLTQEEQQGSILDDKYNTAEQDLQNAQNQLQSLAASLVRTKSEVSVDKKLVASDAVAAYVYGTPQSNFVSYFSSSAALDQARDQYTNQIVGNLSRDERAAGVGVSPSESGDAAAIRCCAGPDRSHAGQVARVGERAGSRGDEDDARPGTGAARQRGRRGRDRGSTARGGRSGEGGEPAAAGSGRGGGRGRGNGGRSRGRSAERRGGDRRGEPGVRRRRAGRRDCDG